jgi:putative oxidoreductase
MKIATLIARILLGLLFLVFGLNGFLHFIPMPPPTGLAGQYFTVLFVSHYMVLVFLLQVIGGALLLANRFVPLALILLGPILVNILLFHSLMAPAGLPLALLATALWGIVFSGVRRAFAGVFVRRVQTEAERRLASDL